MKYEQFLADVGKTRDEVEGMGGTLSRVKSVLSAAHDLVGKNERLEKENAELRGELDDWKGNAEEFQPDVYMKLPVDADGVPIHVGDKMDVDGDAMTVLGYRLYNGTLLLIVKKGESNLTYTPKPSEIRHFKYVQPDSWEKLEKDAMGRACELAGSGNLRCSECEWGKEGIGCQATARLEILKRAKKLAGIEEEAQR